MTFTSCMDHNDKCCPTCGKKLNQRKIPLSSFLMVKKLHAIDNISGFLRVFMVIYLFLPFFLPGIINYFAVESVSQRCCSEKECLLKLYGYQ